MKKVEETWNKNGYVLRPTKKEDAQSYYQQNFTALDEESVHLSGSKSSYTHDEVVTFFLNCIDALDRYDFLIISPDARIIGESVINEIDWEARCANFRIYIFDAKERNKGIGTWAVEMTRDFAFARLKLHRLELDVFSFNPQAESVYLKAGFKKEGIRRDAIWNGKEYGDDILMSILESEWEKMKEIKK